MVYTCDYISKPMTASSLLQSLVTLTGSAIQSPSSLLTLLTFTYFSLIFQVVEVHKLPSSQILGRLLYNRKDSSPICPHSTYFSYRQSWQSPFFFLSLFWIIPDASGCFLLVSNKKIFSPNHGVTISMVSLLCPSLTCPYLTTEVFARSIYCISLYNSCNWRLFFHSSDQT